MQVVEDSSKVSPTQVSSSLHKSKHSSNGRVVTSGSASCLLTRLAADLITVLQYTANPSTTVPGGVGQIPGAGRVLVGRVPPGSLKGGGLMIVVERSTVEPCVKTVEGPVLVVIVLVPEVIVVGVVFVFDPED